MHMYIYIHISTHNEDLCDFQSVLNGLVLEVFVFGFLCFVHVLRSCTCIHVHNWCPGHWVQASYRVAYVHIKQYMLTRLYICNAYIFIHIFTHNPWIYTYIYPYMNRIYVLVTGYMPLTVWLYRSGFARFSAFRFSGVCVCACVHVCMYVCMYVCMRVCGCIDRALQDLGHSDSQVCMCVCIWMYVFLILSSVNLTRIFFVCMYTHTHTWICIYLCIHIYTHMHT